MNIQGRNHIEAIRNGIGERLYWLALGALLIWCLLPLSWALPATFKEYAELFHIPPKLVTESFSFNNYIKVFNLNGYWKIMFNSGYISVLSTIVTLVVSILAGYGFARYNFRFKGLLLMLIFIPRIIPRVSLIIPLFRALSYFGLLNTYAALVITYAASSVSLATWVTAGFFKTIPIALEESALIDGAKKWQVIWHILIPMSLPAMITVGVFSVREAWNEFAFAVSFTNSVSMRTLPIQLFMLRDGLQLEDWTVILSFTMLSILPILIVYIFFQRRVVEGIVSGAVKE